MNVEDLPAAASVSATAELCQLSRSRFYDLMQAGVFPEPIRHPSSKRRIYSRDLIQECLRIRATGQGANGLLVVFNRKLPKSRRSFQNRKSKPDASQYNDLVADLKGLGMTTTSDSVSEAVSQLYPNGLDGQDEGDVLTQVFLHLQANGASK